VVNEGVTATDLGNGRLQVVLRMKRGTGFMARFMPPVLERTVKLDELGAFVFRQIDGRRTVLQIVDAFAQRYKANRREAELSTVEFIRALVQRQIISIAIK
jgi:hypothetical protein